jgi:prepilin-type N-terminal cleavage/methylation domain-containing protein
MVLLNILRKINKLVNWQTSKLANWQTKTGFTLVEIMLSVVILSFGTVLLQQAFFNLLDTHNLCRNYVEADLFFQEKLWETQHKLDTQKELPLGLQEGEFAGRRKSFKWRLEVSKIEELEALYKVNLALFWQEGSREKNLFWTTYVGK